MSMPDRIPLVDLAWQHARIADELLPHIHDRMARGAFILGPDVAAFEADFASYSGRTHCVGVGNGTDAIELALRAASLQPGDEVIVPTNSFISTAAAVIRAGGVPVMVDCDARYLLMDPGAVERAITKRSRAVIPVHLFGQMAPVDVLAPLARAHGLTMIEDAAQSQGATRFGHGPGHHGVAAATSFYPGKNLGAYGDGGAVLTDSEEIARGVRLLRDHGSETKYEHAVVGTNSRLDALQALVLSAKLKRLDEWNQLRRDAAALYTELLEPHSQIVAPEVLEGNIAVWHLYVIRIKNRDQVAADMRAKAIEVGIHYPIPIHRQAAMRAASGPVADVPNADAAAAEILSLPLYPGITRDQQLRVVEALVASSR